MVFLFINGFFTNIDFKLIDLKFILRGTRPHFKDVVIITVDEKSISKLGRFPWKRSMHAELIRKLNAAGVRIIAFDVLFTEPDIENPSADRQLATAIKNSKVPVVLAEFFFLKDGVIGESLKPPPEFAAYSYLGHVNIFPEIDGIARKIPILIYRAGEFHPSLSWRVFSLIKGVDPVEAAKNMGLLNSDINEVMINYLGGYESVKYYSYSDIISGKNLNELKDKIALVGGTATGLFDFKAVPNVPVFPGVEIHAHALENFIYNRFLREIHRGIPVAIFIVAFFASYITMKVRNIFISVMYLFFTTLFIAFLDLYFFSRNIQIYSFSVYLINFLVYFSLTLYKYIISELEKGWIKKAFSQYVSPQVMNEIMKDPSKLQIGGKRQIVTVLFSDIENFTHISESLQVDVLARVINFYLDSMTGVILEHNGVVDKFIGDAIMAFWNAPIEQENHEFLACSSAIKMLEKENEIKKGTGLVLKTRFGINTGEVNVGNFGSKQRFDYTVMGDNVNLASRLEGVNKFYGTRIVISEVTYNAVKNKINARKLDLIRVKGKEKPILIYSLEPFRDDLSEFNEAVELYISRKFADALRVFEEFKKKYPDDTAADIYIERCNYYINNPPPQEWDGVFVFETK